ncbi:hypothetical protein FPZ54_02100 [Sphingomonas suaedae]|uniref:Uncharacterized protein n=1 Tax=Sphingomonas suaedae TaxID=2599297 RepID=A0A518RBU4_9SPHN|nr:hypothetical protein [Sphingomonas suaedae]QDX24940.1 hypothetical protein FPZ54_02100 [Sphingomonas suaedae]
MDDDSELFDRIVAFVRGVGISVTTGQVAPDSFLPAIAVVDGRLVIDRARLQWPGDILHEAGHIAVTEAAARATLNAVPDDGGEELAAIAWSYAAARAIGLDSRTLFHAQGYRGDGDWLAETFDGGTYIGLPMLVWMGMAGDPSDASDGPTYPTMRRWLR